VNNWTKVDAGRGGSYDKGVPGLDFPRSGPVEPTDLGSDGSPLPHPKFFGNIKE
jgi:hypothetical protein